MMMKVPENLQSVRSPGGRFGLRWCAPEDKDLDVQLWHLVRSDYPITAQNAAGLFSGGMDLFVTRWELHPSVTEVVEDTAAEGKHYVVLGQLSSGQIHFPDGFEVDPDAGGPDAIGGGLSKSKALRGWVKGVKKKDRYSGMF